MKRGDLVTIAVHGEYGKPRPALIVQSDLFDEHPSITILPVTSELRETPLFRIRVVPNAINGLQKSLFENCAGVSGGIDGQFLVCHCFCQ